MSPEAAKFAAYSQCEYTASVAAVDLLSSRSEACESVTTEHKFKTSTAYHAVRRTSFSSSKDVPLLMSVKTDLLWTSYHFEVCRNFFPQIHEGLDSAGRLAVAVYTN